MPKKKKGPGRPTLDRGLGREVMLTVRLRAEEKAKIDEAAKKAGIKLSPWLRERILRDL